MRTWTMWRDAVSPALAAAAAVVSAFVVFGDRVDQLLNSNALLYVMAALDMFRLEVIAVVVLLLLGPTVAGAIAVGAAAGRHVLRTERPGSPAHTEVIVLLLITVVLSVIGAYYAWRYAVGKKLQLARYESNLGWRIREGLEARRGPEMRTLARIGSLVFHDPDSATLLKEIDERSALMARARQLYVQLPDGSVGQMDMLAALCDLDFDRAFCRREVGRLDSFVSDRRGALERLYAAVIERADEAVRSQLDTTCGSAGSIGFCASLLNDLRSTAGRRPYLEALQRAGAKNFIAQAMAATDLRLATLKTMATGVAAGGEPRDD